MQMDLERKGDISIVRIRGTIDITTSPEVKSSFDKILKKGSPKVLINLKGVEYLDSSGLATFVEIFKQVRSAGGALKLSDISGKVKGLFEITKLDKLFDIAEEEEQALSSF